MIKHDIATSIKFTIEAKKIKVLREPNNSRLEKKINVLLTEGWKSTDVLTNGVDHDIYTIMKKE